MKKQNRHEVELNRMYDELAKLKPGTEEYEKLLETIHKAEACKKDKKEIDIKLVTFAGSVLLVPVIDTVCKKNLAKYIAKIEEFDTFTSSAGRSISSWFRWK